MIDESVRKFLEVQKLGYVATISEDNTPNLSPKGTVMAWDSETIVFADIRSPRTIRNLSANPNVEINVVDPLSRKGFRFSGTAKILQSGPKFDKILTYYKNNGIKSSINAIVLVDVSKMSEIISPLYDLGVSENEIRSKWKARLLG